MHIRLCFVLTLFFALACNSGSSNGPTGPGTPMPTAKLTVAAEIRNVFTVNVIDEAAFFLDGVERARLVRSASDGPVQIAEFLTTINNPARGRHTLELRIIRQRGTSNFYQGVYVINFEDPNGPGRQLAGAILPRTLRNGQSLMFAFDI